MPICFSGTHAAGKFLANILAELIYAPPAVAAVAARHATRTIPIVFAAVTDPVGRGLVSSLAHPGGNATGVVSVAESLVPKLIQLLHEILPGAKRIGLLSDPNEPITALGQCLDPVFAPGTFCKSFGILRTKLMPALRACFSAFIPSSSAMPVGSRSPNCQVGSTEKYSARKVGLFASASFRPKRKSLAPRRQRRLSRTCWKNWTRKAKESFRADSARRLLLEVLRAVDTQGG